MTSYRYYFSQKTISPPILSKEKELLKDGIRSDGRNIDSFRRICMLNFLSSYCDMAS